MKNLARGPAGMSLVELMVSMALMGIVGLAAAELLSTTSRESLNSGNRASMRSDLELLSGTLQKTMASGDIRFFAFTGGLISPAKRALSRVLVPQPGRCRDLTTTGCEEQSSMIYVHYDKRSTAGVTAICSLPGTTAGEHRIVVDMHDNAYGNATYNASQKLFNIGNSGGTVGGGFASGPMNVNRGALLALFDPPRAVLWMVSGVASPLALLESTAGDLSFQSGGPFPLNCASMLKSDSSGRKKIDRLVAVPVKPYVLTQFTGGNVVTAAEIEVAWGRFPMRLFATNLRSLGPGLMTGTGLGRVDFGYADCSLDPADQKLICLTPPLITVRSISRVRMESFYDVAFFFDSGNASLAERFEILATGMTPNSGCTAPGCLNLPIPPDGQIGSVVDSSESFDNLKVREFSLLKQEVLSNLRVRLLLDAATLKEETFDVRFP